MFRYVCLSLRFYYCNVDGLECASLSTGEFKLFARPAAGSAATSHAQLRHCHFLSILSVSWYGSEDHSSIVRYALEAAGRHDQSGDDSGAKFPRTSSMERREDQVRLVFLSFRISRYTT